MQQQWLLRLAVSAFLLVALTKKNKQPTLAQNTIGGFSDDQGFSGRGGGIRQNGVIGSVATVTATSITVNNQRTGTSSTKTINDSTTITNNGTKVTTSDIKVGDNVFIRTSTSDTTIATNIDINLLCQWVGHNPAQAPQMTPN